VKQLVIALAGGPGSGKSTLMHLLTVALGDERYVNPPLPDGTVAEYARTFIDRRIRLEERSINVYDQLLLHRGQKRREDDLLAAGYPVVISDSPTFLQLVYYFEADPLEGVIGSETRDLIRRELERAAHEGIGRYDIIFFLPPVIPFRRDPTRRQEAAEERARISDRIEAFLKLSGARYVTLRQRSRQGRVREALEHLVPLLRELQAPR